MIAVKARAIITGQVFRSDFTVIRRSEARGNGTNEMLDHDECHLIDV